jgi:hypothetical protein
LSGPRHATWIVVPAIAEPGASSEELGRDHADRSAREHLVPLAGRVVAQLEVAGLRRREDLERRALLRVRCSCGY